MLSAKELSQRLSVDTIRQLRDAGFPQRGRGVRFCTPCPAHLETIDDDCVACDWLYDPSLEDLIAACGATFHHLINNIHEWKAMGVAGEFGRGETHKDAVADLYLVLVGKKLPVSEEKIHYPLLQFDEEHPENF